MELQEYINQICEQIESPVTASQRVRYLKSHLDDLLEFQKNNPDRTDVPTHLELYCSQNPDALECRIYNV